MACTILYFSIRSLNTGLGCVSVSKFGLSVALGSANTLISNAFDLAYAATAMFKPVSTGVHILKSGMYIVICRFAITTNDGGRIGYGIRAWKSDGDYADSSDANSSSSARNDTYIYIRAGHYNANTYLRPIASAASGGTCTGCSLTVLSLKAG
jgi:hypothetical protein